MDAITKIPPELLSHILEETTLLDPDSPLTLSLVCRYFHRVTITSPRVWRQLYIALSHDQLHSDADAVRKAGLWFRRSGTCDVSIDIASTSTVDGIGTAAHTVDLLKPSACHVGELPGLIRREKGRVEKLTLRFPTEAQARFFLSAIYPPSLPCSLSSCIDYCDVDCLPTLEEPIPSLRSLSIQISTPSTRPSQNQDPLPPLSPLNLTHLHLSNCLDPLPLSFANLQELTIHNHLRAQPIPLAELVGMLKATAELRILDIEARISVPSSSSLAASLPAVPSSTSATSHQPPHSDPPSEANDIPTNPLVLPHLHTLTLRTNNIPSILASIIPPSLHTLSLDDLDGNRPDAARELGESLRRILVRMDMPVAKLSSSNSSSFSSTSTFTGDSYNSPFNSSKSSRPQMGLTNLTLRNTSFPALLLTHWVPVWEWCLRRMRRLKKVEVPWIVGDLIAAASEIDSNPPRGDDTVGKGKDDDGVGEGDEEERAQDNEIPCTALETVIMPRCPVEVVRRFTTLRPGVVVVV